MSCELSARKLAKIEVPPVPSAWFVVRVETPLGFKAVFMSTDRADAKAYARKEQDKYPHMTFKLSKVVRPDDIEMAEIQIDEIWSTISDFVE